MRPLILFALLLAACSGGDTTADSNAAGGPASKTAGASADDPYLWLENVEGKRALDQVKAWNARTAKRLASAPDFAATKAKMLAILNDKSRIAEPETILGDKVSNHWTDAEHPLGLWRIATIESYIAGKPAWRVLIDLDKLSKAEGKTWVWKGATCLAPDYNRCMVGLSNGGTDALIEREFDVPSGTFVKNGFVTPEAKTDVAWVDGDALLISTAYGGKVTNSGYGIQARTWHRGEALDAAKLLYEGSLTDVVVGVHSLVSDGKIWPMVQHSTSFWTSDEYHVAPDGTLVRAPLPDTATIEDMLGGKVIARLNKDWNANGRTLKAGTVVAYDAAALTAGKPAPIETVFAPDATQAVEQIAAGKDRLYIALLQNVAGKLLALRDTGGSWTAAPVPVADNSNVTIRAAGGTRDVAFYSVEDFAHPERLMATRSGGTPVQVESMRQFFDPKSIQVTQRFAVSKDGTRIPYFVVRSAGATGPLPTIIHAYGGFRTPNKPTYLIKNPSQAGPGALFWIQQGGSFVAAGIRGGGEYGPAWHEAALREKRQNSFDDLYAVAEDLKAQGLASKLAVSGRSQGGLLVGVAMTQRPDLWDAVLMGVPLADMKRFSKLGAGASWIGEYGDPDVPADWAFISKYSPYQNLKKDADYPPVLIYTSTKDDRVHPGHARKMAARLEEQGHPFEYYENIEGGHGGTANPEEHAYRSALVLAFLKRELM